MIWLTTTAVIGLFMVWTVWPRTAFTERRRVDRLARKFRELLNGAPKSSMLILEVERDGPFLQFSHASDLIENFPLVTDQHRELESKFRQVLHEHQLSVSDETGTGGASSIEIKLPENPEAAATFSQLIMVEVFGLNLKSRIKTSLLV